MSTSLYELRRENLRRLLDERGKGARQQLALKLNWTPAHVSHLLRAPGRPTARLINEDTARELESALGLLPGALDKDPTAAATDLSERDALMLEVMAMVTREAQALGVAATREQILAWARAGLLASLEAGRVNEAAIRVLVRYVR